MKVQHKMHMNEEYIRKNNYKFLKDVEWFEQ
jgi:hypothetical protein